MKKVWLLENEQARWFEFEEPHDMPNDVTVTMLTETEQPAQQEPVVRRFEEWLDEIENYGSRRERLGEELPISDTLINWLRAAYDVGYEEGSKNET